MVENGCKWIFACLRVEIGSASFGQNLAPAGAKILGWLDADNPAYVPVA
jgi:hypothetical protein